MASMCKKRRSVCALLLCMGANLAHGENGKEGGHATVLVTGSLYAYEDGKGSTIYTNSGCPERTNCRFVTNYVERSGVLWSSFFSTAKGDLFISRSESIERDGDLASSWVISNFRKPLGQADGAVALSTISYWSADCKAKRLKIAEENYYSEAYATGDMVKHNMTEAEMSRPIPGTVSEAVYSKLCQKPAQGKTSE